MKWVLLREGIESFASSFHGVGVRSRSQIEESYENKPSEPRVTTFVSPTWQGWKHSFNIQKINKPGLIWQWIYTLHFKNTLKYIKRYKRNYREIFHKLSFSGEILHGLKFNQSNFLRYFSNLLRSDGGKRKTDELVSTTQFRVYNTKPTLSKPALFHSRRGGRSSRKRPGENDFFKYNRRGSFLEK